MTLPEPQHHNEWIDGRKTRSKRTETLTERVHRLILEDIVRGTLVPGDLVQLSSLADKYEVSRTPVREALNLLERDGVITAVAYKGFFVRPIEMQDVHDVFFMRRLLEGAGTELATKRVTPEIITKLRQATLPDVDYMTIEYDDITRDFHHSIISAAGSPRLLSTFEDLYNDVRRLQYAGIGTPRPDLIHDEHMKILDAIELGDAALARRRMEEHLDQTRSRALNAWVEWP